MYDDLIESLEEWQACLEDLLRAIEDALESEGIALSTGEAREAIASGRAELEMLKQHASGKGC